MVLPENMSMWRSFVDIGLTTISSVWKTPSTTMPKVWLPTWVTTIEAVLGDPRSNRPSILSSFFRWISGKELVAQPENRGVLDALDAVCSLLGAPHGPVPRPTIAEWPKTVAGGFHDQGPRTMAKVSGILMVTEQPSPATDLMSMVPPIWSILVRHHVHADGRGPETEVDGGPRWEKPGAKDELVDLGFRHLSPARPSLTRPFWSAFALIRSVLRPAAIVGDADDDVGRPRDRRTGEIVPCSPLPLAVRLGRRLQAMVGGVADHVRQGILDQVEHLAVELGVGTVHLELDLFCRVRPRGSRTIRGSFCQALPIGCMRVFMTPFPAARR